MYHAIVIEKSFKDPTYPQKFRIFNKKHTDSWKIIGIVIKNDNLDTAIRDIQDNMKRGSWYAHLYNGKNLIVVFKTKVFKVSSDKSTWKPIIEYGKGLNIPKEQLDFSPNNFEDENKYFLE